MPTQVVVGAACPGYPGDKGGVCSKQVGVGNMGTDELERDGY